MGEPMSNSIHASMRTQTLPHVHKKPLSTPLLALALVSATVSRDMFANMVLRTMHMVLALQRLIVNAEPMSNSMVVSTLSQRLPHVQTKPLRTIGLASALVSVPVFPDMFANLVPRTPHLVLASERLIVELELCLELQSYSCCPHQSQDEK